MEHPRKTVSLAGLPGFYGYTQYMTPSDDPVFNLAPFDDDFSPDPPAEAVAELPAQLRTRGQCHCRDPE